MTGKRQANAGRNDSELDLWQRIVSFEALSAAWAKVLSNEGSGGGDGVTLRDFGANSYANLMQLRAELLAGTYQPRPFRKVALRKRKPGYRVLTIPSIRDRVVDTSIAAALTPILEAVFEDCSFAYRPNRGVARAVERIERWRRQGFEVVIEADIVGFFDNVDHLMLMDKLEDVLLALPGGPVVTELVAQILFAHGVALGTPGKGLAQGSPLSPLLANLYLDALDEQLESKRMKIVRFADDFVILCKSRKAASTALERCKATVAAHGLELHEDGTRIVSFDKGFDFIGYLFLKTLALKEDRSAENTELNRAIKLPVADDGAIELDELGSRFEPRRKTLYILDPSHSLSRRNRSFSVLRDDGSELIAIPHRRISRVEIGPGVDYGKPAVELALEAHVELAFIDSLGQSRGSLSPDTTARAGLQLSLAKGILSSSFRLEIAKALVAARIYNQRIQLLRLNRNRDLTAVEGALRSLRRNSENLSRASSVNEALGYEGASAAVYWQALGGLLRPPVTALQRSRPAKDPFNATINYLTGILQRDIRSALQRSGLRPGFGFLHGVRDHHDALVFDQMEPFRAPLTEGLAVFLFNARRLRDDMFFEDGLDQRMGITQGGRRAIVEGYETAAARRVKVPAGSKRLAWRPMMLFQARSLARAVERSDTALFTPYRMSP